MELEARSELPQRQQDTLGKAVEYLETAEDAERSQHWTAAAGNAVHDPGGRHPS